MIDLLVNKLDMAPRFSSDDVMYLANGNPKLIGERPLGDAPRLVPRPNRPHGSISQFRMRKHFSSGVTSFGAHIAPVVCVGAKKQVVRVDARWVVASMADVLPDRDGAEVNFPGQAVREGYDSLGYVLIKPSVSPLHALASPQPTPRGFANLFPEPRFKRGVLHVRSIA